MNLATPQPAVSRPVQFTRPMLSIWAVLAVTDFASEDHVLAAIEEGQLLWAWNIGTAKAHARDLRVWAPSVLEYLRVCDHKFVGSARCLKCGQELPTAPGLNQVEESGIVMRSLIPGDRPVIAAGALARAFNCSGTHISDLVRQGLLKIARCRPQRLGRPGPPPQMLDRPSVRAFLEERRWP